MFKHIRVLDNQQIIKLKEIAKSATYVDGKISNPFSKNKNNLQLHGKAAYEESSRILYSALMGQPEFREFAFPDKVAPPLMACYKPSMSYGLHADSSTIGLPNGPLRSDLSCTIFLSDPNML